MASEDLPDLPPVLLKRLKREIEEYSRKAMKHRTNPGKYK
jgi:hypothetical protein